MKRIVVISGVLLWAGLALGQKTISGVTPAKTLQVKDQTVQFNGAGLREKFFLDLYVGSLYLKTPTSDAKKVIEANEAMAIKLNIVSGLITREKMITAINEGFEKSSKGNTAAFQKEIDAFKGAFSEEIKEGNTFEIAYHPTDGILIKKNDKLLKTIPGLEFKKIVFGIWLCDDPADEDLKDAMLGND